MRSRKKVSWQNSRSTDTQYKYRTSLDSSRAQDSEKVWYAHSRRNLEKQVLGLWQSYSMNSQVKLKNEGDRHVTTSARKTGRPWRRPNARAISAATDPPAHPTRPQKVKSIPAMCETSAAEHKQTVRVPQGDCAVIIVATYVLESICYLLRVDYDGAGCVPSFCRLRQPDSSCDAGHGYVSGCVRWLHGHTSMVTRRGRCSDDTGPYARCQDTVFKVPVLYLM